MSNLSPAAAHTGPDDYLTSSIGFLDQQHVEARSEAARRALGSGSGGRNDDGRGTAAELHEGMVSVAVAHREAE
jgi:hypothetical protein